MRSQLGNCFLRGSTGLDLPQPRLAVHSPPYAVIHFPCQGTYLFRYLCSCNKTSPSHFVLIFSSGVCQISWCEKVEVQCESVGLLRNRSLLRAAGAPPWWAVGAVMLCG